MGLFDTIVFNCPDCGEEIGAQSKGGACLMDTYDSKDVPIDVAQDCNRHAPFDCKCGASWEFANVFPKQNISLIISRA